MTDEPHDVVKLLLTRMESHPEEFKSPEDRWDRILVEVLEYANEAEVSPLNAKLRDIRLAELHEDMMDELLNGPERRRMEEEEDIYEKHLAQALSALKASQLGGAGIPVGNGGTTATRYPTSTDMENNGIMGALRNLI